MSARSIRLQAIAAGLGAALADVWPVLLIWSAGASGSVGDLRQVRLLWVGLAWSALLGLVAGWCMAWALPRAEASPRLGRWDPWGAWATGLGTYLLAVTVLAAATYGVLLVDEDQSLRSREPLVLVGWVAGHAAAAAVALAAARGVLGRGLGAVRAQGPRPSPPPRRHPG